MVKLIVGFPDSSLMPNRKNGRHWGKHQKAKKAYRDEGYYAAKAAPLDFDCENNISITLVFYPKDNRKRDLDNLLAACKPVIDGISLGYGIDDSLFKPITIDRGEKDKDNPRVEIFLTSTQMDLF